MSVEGIDSVSTPVVQPSPPVSAPAEEIAVTEVEETPVDSSVSSGTVDVIA